MYLKKIFLIKKFLFKIITYPISRKEKYFNFFWTKNSPSKNSKPSKKIISKYLKKKKEEVTSILEHEFLQLPFSPL